MSISEVKNKARRAVGAALLVALLASTGARAAGAQEPSMNASPGWHGCEHGGRPPPPGPIGPQGPLDIGEDRPPPYLVGLVLSEEQQDKIFEILHVAAPGIRDHLKAAKKARDGLRDLAQSTAFTDDKATPLVQAESAAEVLLLLLRARIDHEIFMVLTPEQRVRLAERRRDRDAPPHEGPPPR